MLISKAVTNDQKLNWKLVMLLNVRFFLFNAKYKKIHESALRFWKVFLRILCVAQKFYLYLKSFSKYQFFLRLIKHSLRDKNTLSSQ